MTDSLLHPKIESPREIIRLLQQELAETNREVMALTIELDRRVEERTAALRAIQTELERKNAGLEAANKELEAFSYSVSHDLRAPLRHLQGFTQALSEDYAENLGEQARAYLAGITKAARRMNELIDALLKFSRAGQRPLERERVDFAALVQKVIAEMKPDVGERAVEWNVQQLPAVHGDPSLLRQVWVNLISNAVKYTREKDVARVEIGCRTDAPAEWIFFVRDNGTGFDMAHADKLFGLFQRLHSRDQFEGVGLGLANVRHIVERHGGRCWAEAKPGCGATFYFSLPKN